MVTFEEFDYLVQKVLEDMPAVFFTELNGGVMIVERIKLHPDSTFPNLYIMGEYQIDPAMGRRILLYYGSFMESFPNMDPESLKEQISHIVRHEFRHHLEIRGGEHDLEDEDKKSIAHYKSYAAPTEKTEDTHETS